jgi:hypothetical protein
MAQPQRRVVEELSRLWNQVVEKGKVLADHQKNHQPFHLRLKEAVQNSKVNLVHLRVPPATPNNLMDRAKDRVNSSMTAYEDFIGISQVKAAHQRVLEVGKPR